MSAVSIEIQAPMAAIIEVYRRVEAWPQWDPEVLAANLPAGLTAGATGWLRPRAGPLASITVTRSGPDCFDVESRLPLCRMAFGHRLEATPAGTRVTHDVRFAGLLAPLFRLLIGRGIVASMPGTLAGLKRHVEAGAGLMVA
ncbi:MAG: SRPBCC family protein [Hyphomonadaceae bacterium]|nr:SRPBCC family protein [Hyphomonadaceae bacterium]